MSEYQTSNRKDHDYEPSENSPRSQSKCDPQNQKFPNIKTPSPALIVSKQGLNTSFGENVSINDKTNDVVFATPLSDIRMEENSKASTENLRAEIQDLQKTSGENSMEFYVPKDD
jgi:hypothetical protein